MNLFLAAGKVLVLTKVKIKDKVDHEHSIGTDGTAAVEAAASNIAVWDPELVHPPSTNVLEKQFDVEVVAGGRIILRSD